MIHKRADLSLSVLVNPSIYFRIQRSGQQRASVKGTSAEYSVLLVLSRWTLETWEDRAISVRSWRALLAPRAEIVLAYRVARYARSTECVLQHSGEGIPLPPACWPVDPTKARKARSTS